MSTEPLDRAVYVYSGVDYSEGGSMNDDNHTDNRLQMNNSEGVNDDNHVEDSLQMNNSEENTDGMNNNNHIEDNLQMNYSEENTDGMNDDNITEDCLQVKYSEGVSMNNDKHTKDRLHGNYSEGGMNNDNHTEDHLLVPSEDEDCYIPSQLDNEPNDDVTVVTLDAPVNKVFTQQLDVSQVTQHVSMPNPEFETKAIRFDYQMGSNLNALDSSSNDGIVLDQSTKQGDSENDSGESTVTISSDINTVICENDDDHGTNLVETIPDTEDTCLLLDTNTDVPSTSFTKSDSMLSLPDFDLLYETEHDDEIKLVLDNEMIKCDIDSAASCTEDHSSSLGINPLPSFLEEKSVIELMREIREDLSVVSERNTSSPEFDLGLKKLFENDTDYQNTNSGTTKTKSAKKRKKQQLRLKKLLTPNVPPTGRRKFAQSFEELKNSRVEYEDHNLDSSITCPVCLDLYHLPSVCQPCGHMFCDLCLRRLTSLGTEGIPCPLCRAVISSCELNREFDENLLLNYPGIYTARAVSERHSKYRHQLLPYTPAVPLRKRIMRQLIATRNHQSDLRWMSHDSFKFLLGCTVGMFIASLVMLYSRVTSVSDARDINVVFLSVLLGATVTYVVFKYVKI